MRMAIILAPVTLLIAVLVYLAPGKTKPLFDVATTKQNLESLERSIPLLEASLKDISKQQPLAESKIGANDASISAILKGIPGALVTRQQTGNGASSRVIHFSTTRVEDKETFSKKQADRFSNTLTPQDLDLLYQEHQLKVLAKQLQEMAVLKHLIRQHGLATVHVFLENSEGAKSYSQNLENLKAREKEAIPLLREELAEIKELANGLAGEELSKANKTENSLRQELEKHEQQMQNLGPAGMLYARGEAITVIPLEVETVSWARITDPLVFLIDANSEKTRDLFSKLPKSNGYWMLTANQPTQRR